MKRLLLFFLFVSQMVGAAEVSTFEEAQKMALATNKLIIVDFWATWCGPCKKMDADTWSDDRVVAALDDFIFVKIDIDRNKELAQKYGINAIPNVFFLDANGVAVHSSLGYSSANEMLKSMGDYAISTEMISMELINHYKNPNYTNALRLLYKYYDFTLYADGNLKSDLINVCREYLNNAKSFISKKDENFEEKKQKLELLKLYDLAYLFNFDKLDKKLSEFKSNDINPVNKYDYWFLVYLSQKGLGKDLTNIESELKNNDLENVIADSNKILDVYQKSIKK